MKSTLTFAFLIIAQIIAAQCNMNLNFANQSNIPNDCSIEWEESGVKMSIEAVDPNDCSNGGCNFTKGTGSSTITLGPAQLVVDLSSFNGRVHAISIFSSGIKPVARLYRGPILLREVSNSPSSSIYLDFPDSLAADQLIVSGCQTSVRIIRIFYNCDEGLPPGNNCLTFEDAIPNPNYTGQDGQIAYTEGDVSIYKMPYYDAQLNPQSGGQFFVEPTGTFGVGSGELLWCSFTNALFDFSTLNDRIVQLSFDFLEGSTPSNIKVNDEFLYVGDLRFAPAAIANGVRLSVETPLGNSPATRVTLTGAVRSLMVGGQEFFMDNVCLTTEPVINVCIPFLSINQGAGATYGNSTGMSPGDLLPTIDPQVNITLQEYEVIVPPASYLTFGNLDIPDFALHSAALDSICLDFDFSQVPDQVAEITFDIYEGSRIFIGANGTNQIYAFDDADLTTGRNQNFSWEIEDRTVNGAAVRTFTMRGIFDSFQLCGIRTLIGNLCYNTSGACAIGNLRVEQLPCGPNDEIYVKLDFDHANTMDTFLLTANDSLLGSFLYNDLPLTIGPLPFPNPQAYTFEVTDHISSGCSNRAGIDVACASVCSITNVIAEPSDCDDNGEYEVKIDFDYNNTGVLGFMIIGGGNFYGSFDYSQLPITLGPFAANGSPMEFNILDIATPSCIGFANLEAVECNECEITDLEVTPLDCVNDSTYHIKINFEVSNPGNDFFEVFDHNGNNIGFFRIDDLPVTLNDFESRGGSDDFILVKINDNPNCIAEIEFDAPDCSNNCLIENMFTIPDSCNAQGQFFITLDFDYQNTSDSFEVFGNGNNYGTFSYTQLPIILGPFDGDGISVYEFIASDLEKSCRNLSLLDAPDCNPVCRITDLEVIPFDCVNDSTYNLLLNFNVTNPSEDFFEVFDQFGDVIGFFRIDDLPVNINNFQNLGGNTDFLSVQIINNPNCVGIIDFDALDCSQVCQIDGLVVEPQPCTPNNIFYVDLDFDYQHTSDSFQVVGNGNNYGTFSYTQLPLNLGPFNGDGTVFYEFVVKDFDNPDCQDVFELGAIDCDTANCEISNLDVYAIDCNPDGSFSIAINFDHQNAPSAAFEVAHLGDSIGTFNYADLPVFITSFSGSGDPVEEITICDVDATNCCANATFDALFCDSCSIYNLVATASACNSVGEFFVDLDFDYTQPGAIGFQVLGNGNNYGSFSYNNLPIRLGPFDDSDPAVLEFIVFDIINLNCTNDTEVDAPDCFNDCIDFESLALQVFSSNDYSAGETLFTVGGIPVSIDSILYSNGTAGIDKVTIFESSVGTPPTQVLIPENSAVVFDFSGLSNPVTYLEFDFYGNQTGDFNLTVNSSLIHIVDNLADLPGEPAPGVFLTIEFEPGNVNGKMILEGPIESLSIAGQQLAIDNLCFGNSPPGLSECLQFSTLPCCFSTSSIQIDIGATISIENDVLVKYRDGSIIINDRPNPGPTTFNAQQGNYLTISGELEFDFTELNDITERISFDFADPLVEDIEIAVNNEPFQIVILKDTTYQISSTVSLTVSIIPGLPGEGSLTLEGPVDRFFLKGTRLNIDNVCFDVRTGFIDVWPGDINTDNEANHLDLLSLGIAYGQAGPARSFIATDWQGMAAEDWRLFFADDEVNFKHADTNGDGVVNQNDRTALVENYGSTHGPTATFIEIPGDSEDPVLRVALEEAAPLREGEAFYAPISLGDINAPLSDIYGLAFTIRFNPDHIDPTSVRFELMDDSWLGQNGNDLISIDQTFANEGIIEVAITRIDQEDRSGYGPIAGFIGIIDNIGGKADVEVKLEEVRAINSDEIIIPLYTPVSKVQISTGVGPQDFNGQLKVYPNPASNNLHIHNISKSQMREIQVYNVLGQKMLHLDQPQMFETLDVSHWSAGVYLIEIQVEEQIIRRKVEVMKP